MQIGMIGLGRMGGNMARRLTKGGHQCVVFDRNRESVDVLAKEGPTPAYSLEELVEKLSAPRAVWVMLPSGAPTEETVIALSKLLEPGDAIIDGGNSFYKDDVRRSAMLKPSGIHYLDVGTSGGVWGLERGYCLMIGGDQATARRLDPLFATLAPGPGNIPNTPGREQIKSTAEQGYLYCGPSGAGHFVKMIHNGIEYGLMQAYAEGFDILCGANSDNLPAGLSYNSGEGRWTIQAALEEGVSAEVLSAALFTRFRSRREHSFAEKVLSAMRKGFGGHVEPPPAVKMKQGL